MELIKDRIDPELIGARIRDLRKTRNGKILIETGAKDEESMEKAPRENEEIHKRIRIREPIRPKQKFMVYNFPNKIEERDLIELLLEDRNKEQDVRIIKKIENRKKSTGNWLMETTRELYRTVINDRRAVINWNSIKIKKYVDFRICFKCANLSINDSEPSCLTNSN